MKNRLMTSCAIVAALASPACGVPPETEVPDNNPQRPNILLIVADDMGFSDAGAFGGEMATPNIDALAAEGVLFSEFHVAPNCGPTRGSLLTGVDYHRAGMGGNPEVAAQNQKGLSAYQGFLRDDVVTVTELLHEAGYHTSMAGKWHLGHDAQAHEITRVDRVVENLFDIRGSERNRVVGAGGQAFHVFKPTSGDDDFDLETQVPECGGVTRPQLVVAAPLGSREKGDLLRSCGSNDHQRYEKHDCDNCECCGSRQLPEAVFLGG